MAITKGAKKAHRGSLRKRVFNSRRKIEMNSAVKAIRKLISEGKQEEAGKLIPSTYQAIDKAMKRNVISKNTAARKKSRLSAAIKKSK